MPPTVAEHPNTTRPGTDTPETRFGQNHVPRESLVLEPVYAERRTGSDSSGDRGPAHTAVVAAGVRRPGPWV